MVNNTCIDTISTYAEEINEDSKRNDAIDKLKAELLRILVSAERHLNFFDLASKRYDRALSLSDKPAYTIEQDNMLASLYETLDTIFRGIAKLDFDVLHVQASLDGLGITGDDAGFVHEILDRFEKTCKGIFEREHEFKLKLDFSKPVDERVGITYAHHPHWQDFVYGDVNQSFFLYFADTQKKLAEAISQIPKFWHQRRLRHFYMKRPTLGRYLKIFLTASLKQTKKK